MTIPKTTMSVHTTDQLREWLRAERKRIGTYRAMDEAFGTARGVMERACREGRVGPRSAVLRSLGLRAVTVYTSDT